jgi:hypothetical protein
MDRVGASRFSPLSLYFSKIFQSFSFDKKGPLCPRKNRAVQSQQQPPPRLPLRHEHFQRARSHTAYRAVAEQRRARSVHGRRRRAGLPPPPLLPRGLHIPPRAAPRAPAPRPPPARLPRLAAGRGQGAAPGAHGQDGVHRRRRRLPLAAVRGTSVGAGS